MIIKADLKYASRELINRLWKEIIFSLLYSALIYYLYEHHELTFLSSFGVIPVGLLATMLSVFLAFRNNNAYGRWWEARQLWGEFINASRNFNMQIRSLILEPCESGSLDLEEAKLVLIKRHVAYAHLLRMQLRGTVQFEPLEPYLTEDDISLLQSSSNPCNQLLLIQGKYLEKLSQAGSLPDFRLIALSQSLGRFYDVQGGCERIKKTPFPYEYNAIIHILIWMLIASLPFYLLGLFAQDAVAEIGIIPLTVISTLLVGFANKAGEVLEDPFENRVHDVPLTSMCQTIESDLLGIQRNVETTPASRFAIKESWVSW